MAMQMSTQCRRQITEPSEGCKLKAYKDMVGVWTIGYGHTSRAGLPVVIPGMRLTMEQADRILLDDLGVFERGVVYELRNTPGVLQREFDALVDLAFNIGLGAFRTSSLLRHYRAGRKDVAANDFLAWNKAGGKVAPGLTKRRAAEKHWFLEGHLAASPVSIADLTTLMPEDMPRVVDHADRAMVRAYNRIVGLAA